MKRKFPIVLVSVHDHYVPGLYSKEEDSDKNDLFSDDEIISFDVVAHIDLMTIDGSFHPVAATLFKLEETEDEHVDNRLNRLFKINEISELRSGSFEIEYFYDSEINQELPKYLILK